MSEKSMPHAASAPLDPPDSPAGYLCLNVPPWVASPPIEAVVFGWGASEDHQLGLDSEEDIDSPKVVESLLGIKFMGRGFLNCPLVGGSRNTLAIDAEGGLWSWGWNARGTLGHGHRDLQRKPACVEALHGVHIAQAAIGGWHCLALSVEGQVYCWGGNEYQQCGLVAPDEQPQPGSQAAAVQAAAAMAAAAAAHGSRSGTEGLLAAAAAAVAKAAGMAGAAVNGNGSLVRNDTAESSAKANGAADTYNYSSVYGVLPAARDILVPRCCMPGLAVKQVACGGMNSVVLTEGGEVWTWGEPWGEFALELQRAPRKVPGAVNIASIACGAFHNMALVADGRVLAWGTNDYGQLGNGSTIYSTTPVEVVDLEEVAVADIAAGGWHSMALSADGQIYVWGRGEYGRLGIADRTGSSKLRPHKVRGLEGHTVVQVAAGGTHSLAVTSSGRMFIWGRASYGRMGLGSSAKDQYSPVEVALPGGHERWKVAAATAGGRHTMCLAVPVRDASLRRDGSRAGSLASNSRGPSTAASVQGEPVSQSQQALLQQLQQQQMLIQQQQEQINRSSGATGSLNTLAAEVAAADGQGNQQQQFGGGAAALRGLSSTSRHGSNTGSAVGSPSAAAQPPPQQQQQRAGSSLSNTSNGDAGGTAAAAAGSGNAGNAASQLPGLSHAMSSPSSYSFAPSPGSSILGVGSPGRGNAGEQLPWLPFSPSIGQRSGSGHPGIGVEAVHAAAAAAGAAAQLGGLKVGSPAPGSSSSGSGLAALQQQRQQWGGSGGGLKPGEQLPVSPRAMPPPMSPSQRRVGFDLGSALNSEPSAAGMMEGDTVPTQNEGLLHSEAAAEDDAAQQEEELKQREQEAMDLEVATLHQQQQEFGTLHQAAATVDLSASIDNEGPAAGDGRQQQQHELQQQQKQQQQRPATSPLALQQQQKQQQGSGSGSGSSSMRRSGSYQGLSSLPGRQQGSSSQLAQLAQLTAAQLHLQQQQQQPGNSPCSGDLLGVSPSTQHHQQLLHGGAAAASGGSSTPPLVSQITRQQSAQLAAAVASSYGRVDASRAASAASLPSLSAGVGVGVGPGSRMGPAVTRVDSDISQEGLSGLAGDEGLLLGCESPTGSSTGPGGASPSNSERALEGLESITGTSPPGGVYDLGLGDAAARCANSHPGREYIHYNTHLS